MLSMTLFHGMDNRTRIEGGDYSKHDSITYMIGQEASCSYHCRRIVTYPFRALTL